jgi:hypothetical protein
MATLNQQQNAVLEEDEDDSRAPARISSLTWDWRSWPRDLRHAVITITLMIVFFGAAIWFLEDQDQNLSQQLMTQTGLQAQAEARLRDSGKEQADIVKHLPVLRDLEARGIYGEEKRLEWVEQLRAIEKRWPGISIKYDISPQKILPKDGATNTPPPPISAGAKLPSGELVKNFAVFSTDMRLTLSLLHEGDALAILEELKAANLGLFTTKYCGFKRPNNTEAANDNVDISAPLAADCQLVWISMNAYTP